MVSPPWVRLIVAIATFMLSLWLLEGFFGTAAAIVIMISMAAHELSHLAASRYFDHCGGVVFLPFFAVTYTETGYDLGETIWTALAGPCANCLIGLACLPFAANPLFQMLAFINFALALFNLAPIVLGTDGLTIVKATRFCQVTPRLASWLFVIAGVVGAVGAAGLMSKLGVFFTFLAACSFAGDVIARIGESWKPRPFIGGLTKRAVTIQALLYLTSVALSVVWLWLLPAVSL